MCINWKNSSRRGNVIQEVEIKFQKVEGAPENKNVVVQEEEAALNISMQLSVAFNTDWGCNHCV